MPPFVTVVATGRCMRMVRACVAGCNFKAGVHVHVHVPATKRDPTAVLTNNVDRWCRHARLDSLDQPALYSCCLGACHAERTEKTEVLSLGPIGFVAMLQRATAAAAAVDCVCFRGQAPTVADRAVPTELCRAHNP